MRYFHLHLHWTEMFISFYVSGSGSVGEYFTFPLYHIKIPKSWFILFMNMKHPSHISVKNTKNVNKKNRDWFKQKERTKRRRNARNSFVSNSCYVMQKKQQKKQIDKDLGIEIVPFTTEVFLLLFFKSLSLSLPHSVLYLLPEGISNIIIIVVFSHSFLSVSLSPSIIFRLCEF